MSDNKKKSAKFSGLAIALWFTAIGLLMFYIPTYFVCSNKVVITLFSVFGWIFILVGIVGSLIELKKIYNKEGLDTIGVSLVFLIPCAVLYYKLDIDSTLWSVIMGKISVVLLFIVGSGMLFYGLSYLVSDERIRKAKENDNEKNSRFLIFLKKITAIVSALGALLAAVLKILEII